MSHLFEQVSGLHHEDIGKALIQSPRTQLNQVLSRAHPTLPSNIVTYMTNPTHPLGSLINGVFDTDRLDYLQRDLISSSLTVPKSDQFNATRLLNGIHFDQATKQLYFDEALVPELEKFIKTRIYLYKTLSYGQADTSASRMCLLFMTRLRKFLIEQKCSLNQLVPGTAQYLEQLLSREKLLSKDIDLERYVRFDDSSIHELLKNAAMTSTDPLLKHLAQGIIYGTLYRVQALPPNTLNQVETWIKQHGQHLKDPDFADLVTTATKTISNYPATTTANNDVIWIKPKAGGPLKPLREMSHYIKHLPPKITTHYLVYDKSQAGLIEPMLQSLER
jgi:HD superfamily phosphohydrolase